MRRGHSLKRFLGSTLVLVLVALCAGVEPQPAAADDVPIIRMAWGFDLHATILLVAASRGEAFRDGGVYLKTVADKQEYELYSGDEKLAIFQMIVTKGSSESAVMLGQKQLDCCVNSSTGMMFALDSGTPMKILCPIHVDGIALVFPKETEWYGWESLKSFIEKSENPVRLGYHSPVSAPRVVLETALREAGLTVTEDPNDAEADVLLVDLKGSRNLLTAFTGQQVEGWVGPSHYPETAEVQGIGKIVLHLKDFPPQGQWYDFPCCVFAAREDSIEAHPEVYQAMTTLLKHSAEWCAANGKEAAAIAAEVIGIPAEAAEAATIVYTTTPTEKWREGIKLYVKVMGDIGKLEKNLKGKSYEEIAPVFFDFRFIEQAQ